MSSVQATCSNLKSVLLANKWHEQLLLVVRTISHCYRCLTRTIFVLAIYPLQRRSYSENFQNPRYMIQQANMLQRGPSNNVLAISANTCSDIFLEFGYATCKYKTNFSHQKRKVFFLLIVQNVSYVLIYYFLIYTNLFKVERKKLKKKDEVIC